MRRADMPRGGRLPSGCLISPDRAPSASGLAKDCQCSSGGATTTCTGPASAGPGWRGLWLAVTHPSVRAIWQMACPSASRHAGIQAGCDSIWCLCITEVAEERFWPPACKHARQHHCMSPLPVEACLGDQATGNVHRPSRQAAALDQASDLHDDNAARVVGRHCLHRVKLRLTAVIDTCGCTR